MNIQDLKQNILDKEVSDDLIIFVCPESNFLAKTYINEICEQKNLSKNYINSLKETTESALSLVFDFSNDMNILMATDIDEKTGLLKDATYGIGTFAEVYEDYSEFKNCVVICSKVSADVKEHAKDYIIEVPKLTDWQIVDYCLAKCPGLSEKAANWLLGACCHDIYKIDSELTKISLVEPKNQLDTLRELIKQPNTDLYIKEDVFKLVDEVIKGNKAVAKEYIKHANDYMIPYISSDGKKQRDMDPIGFTTLMLQKLKNILLLNYRSGIDKLDKNEQAKLLGFSNPNAIYYFKKDWGNIPIDRIMKMIEFLSGIDSKLKMLPSRLDFIDSRDTALFEYVVCGCLACCE